jgi:FkbM family methyltransferase
MGVLNIFKNSLPQPFKESLHRFFWRHVGRHLNLKWWMNSGIIVWVTNPAEWSLYNQIFVEGEYDLPIHRTLAAAQVGKPLIVCDLGANVGYFALRFAHFVRQNNKSSLSVRLDLVEGSPAVYRELQSRWQPVNPVAPVTVNLHHGLVGKRSGFGKILETQCHYANKVVPDKADGGASVSYLDITSLYPEGGDIDLLKCDIEGSEMDFLRNYWDWLTHVKRAVIEFHHDQCDVGEMLELMNRAGFDEHLVLRKTSEFSVHFFCRTKLVNFTGNKQNSG